MKQRKTTFYLTLVVKATWEVTKEIVNCHKTCYYKNSYNSTLITHT